MDKEPKLEERPKNKSENDGKEIKRTAEEWEVVMQNQQPKEKDDKYRQLEERDSMFNEIIEAASQSGTKRVQELVNYPSMDSNKLLVNATQDQGREKSMPLHRQEFPKVIPKIKMKILTVENDPYKSKIQGLMKFKSNKTKTVTPQFSGQNTDIHSKFNEKYSEITRSPATPNDLNFQNSKYQMFDTQPKNKHDDVHFYKSQIGQDKINMALKGHLEKRKDVQFVKKNIKASLTSKINTKEEMKNIKDKIFDGIKNKIVVLEKASNRLQMQKYGFVKPCDMTCLDYKLSMTKNKDEEDYIISQERNDEINLHENKFEQNHMNDHEELISNRHFDVLEEETLTFSQLIIIDNEGTFNIVWSFLESLACILTSYYYTYMSCFGFKQEQDQLFWYMLVIEVYFTVVIILKFITDFKNQGEKFPTREFLLCATNYLKNGFMMDIIPWIPIQVFLSEGDYTVKLLYLPKVIRFITGFSIFDISKAYNFIKSFVQWKLKRLIEKDPLMAEDKDQDHTMIAAQIKTFYGIKVFKLGLTILNFAFFLGMFWIIFCQLDQYYYQQTFIQNIDNWAYDQEWYKNNATFRVEDCYDDFGIFHSDSYSADISSADCKTTIAFGLKNHNQEFFLTTYDFDGTDDHYEAIASVYYAFTSLSTIGFGDFHPISNNERLSTVVILMFGVCIFSVLMDTFLGIISGLQVLSSDLDDGDNLHRFFNLLIRYNKGKPLNQKFQKRVETFFDYKWNHDRLLALKEVKDQSQFDQLPEQVQNKIIANFLFSSYLNKFSQFFKIQKGSSMFQTRIDKQGKRINYYSWYDQEYRDFMINLLLNLEPYIESRNVEIISELSEFNQIIFIQKGKMLVGFDFNHGKRYCLQFVDKCIIGAYGITWNQRAQFNYTSATAVNGFFIRKQNWLQIMNSEPEIVGTLKKNLLLDYLTKIKMKVDLSKKKAIGEFQIRQDYDLIKLSTNKEDKMEDYNKKKVELMKKVLERNDRDKSKEEEIQNELQSISTLVTQQTNLTSKFKDDLENKTQLKEEMDDKLAQKMKYLKQTRLMNAKLAKLVK